MPDYESYLPHVTPRVHSKWECFKSTSNRSLAGRCCRAGGISNAIPRRSPATLPTDRPRVLCAAVAFRRASYSARQDRLVAKLSCFSPCESRAQSTWGVTRLTTRNKRQDHGTGVECQSIVSQPRILKNLLSNHRHNYHHHHQQGYALLKMHAISKGLDLAFEACNAEPVISSQFLVTQSIVVGFLEGCTILRVP